MDNHFWNIVRTEKDLQDSPAYHFEYMCIHNQRIALVRLIHLWHQILLPVSIAVFGFFLNLGIEKTNLFILILGSLLGTLILIFTRIYTLSLDKSVIALYPRIITLEIMLDYKFYRNYLQSKGAKAKEFIDKCQKVQAGDTTELSEKIVDLFCPSDFPSSGRGHKILNIAVGLMIIAFWIVTVYSGYNFINLNAP